MNGAGLCGRMVIPHNADALIVAGARSGSGKTIVTIGLQRALTRTGQRIAGAKIGPDYIDPGFHEAATGAPSVTLDGFAMTPATILGLAAHIDAETIVAEGTMGLFDGVAGGAGATADVAVTLGWPVLLVIDAAGAAQTLAALAHGLATFPGGPRVIGAIANRVASDRHGRMIAAGFARVSVPLIGLIPIDERLALPSRHLGLVQAREMGALGGQIDAIADVIAAHCDIAAIRAGMAPVTRAPLVAPSLHPPGQRIAVARDAAFGFLYPHLLDGWRRAGAEMLFFSPLADEPPPPTADACWLPGGYPELHAGRLAANRRFLIGLRGFRGPIHGECGGYMVLGEAIEDAEGVRHVMAGLLPIETSFARRRLHLGYRRATWCEAMPFAARGATSIGHEFHYATITRNESEPLVDMVDGEGQELAPAGSRNGQVTGSFFHLIA
jgi:cobyrinic acid a,c-diamide synthase